MKQPSDEVLHECILPKGMKAVAGHLGLSQALLHKWCLPPGQSGALNPLDRIGSLVRLLQDNRPLHWLCQDADGFFVSNPAAASARTGPVLQATHQMLKEFSELLAVISESVAGDQSIEPEEARRIRKEWEELKTLTESFVVACEQGSFQG